MGIYVEVRVPTKFTELVKIQANGHEFDVALVDNRGQNEWYAFIVGVLPDYLESEHKKPGLIGRGPNRDEAHKNAQTFLEATFPAWPADKLAEFRAKKDAEEAEKKAAEDAKKAARKAAMAKAGGSKAEPKPAEKAEEKAEDAKSDDDAKGDDDAKAASDKKSSAKKKAPAKKKKKKSGRKKKSSKKK